MYLSCILFSVFTPCCVKTGHPDPVEHPQPGEVKLEEGDVLVECPLYSSTNTQIETDFLVP